MHYKAFISYAHTAEGGVAPALQTALQRIAKPWHRLRSFSIFRDQTNLAATPQLWSNIEQALLQCEYLILLLSPEAARSPWVAKEIVCWLEHRPAERILLVLTAGDLAWSTNSQDFDWDRSSSVPLSLRGVFDQEPYFTDLRHAGSLGELSLQNPRFRDRIVPLAATLHGLPANDLASEELRQHRKTKLLVRVAIISLLMLAAVAIGAALWATRQRGIAIDQRNNALLTQSRFLADLSRQQLRHGAGATAVRLALEALPTDPANPDRPWSPAAEGALYNAMMSAWEFAVLEGHDLGVRLARFSHDDRLLVTVENRGRAMVWDLASGTKLFSVGDGEEDNILHAAFSPDGRHLLTGSREGRVRLFDSGKGGLVREFVNREPRIGIQQGEVSPEQARTLGLDEGKGTVVREVSAGSAAKRAGLQVGDVLIAVDGRPVETFTTLRPPFRHSRAGEPAVVQLYRAGEVRQLTVVPELFEEQKASPLEIARVGFSPDGSLVHATDARVFFWNAKDGTPAGALFPGTHRIEVLKYLASGSHLFIAAGAIEQTFPQLWDTRTLEQVLALDISVLNAEGNFSDSDGPKYVIDNADISADGKRIVTTSYATGALWDAESQALIARLPSGREPRFSPDGGHIATTQGWNANLWNGRDGKEIVVFFGHKGNVHSVNFSPDGRHLVTASEDKTARIWNIETGRELAILRGHGEEVTGALFSHDGKTLLTLSDDQSARLWRFNAFEQSVTNPPSSRFGSLKISRDGQRRIVASRDKKRIEVWDSDRALPLALSGHDSRIVALSISPDGRYVFSVCEQSRYLWNAETGQLIKRIPREEAEPNVFHPRADGVFSPDGQRLVARATSGETVLWEPDSGKAIKTIDPSGAVTVAEFSEDGRRLVTSADGSSMVWNAEDGQLLAEPAAPWVGNRMAIAPDGSRVAVVEQRDVTLWSDKGELVATLRGHAKNPKVVRFSPDSTTLVTVSEDGAAKVWDASDGTKLYDKPLQATEFATMAVFSEDSGRLLLGAIDKRMVHPVFDARSGDLLATLRGHLYPVLDAAFSHDGRRIITGSLDGTARLWDAETGVELVKLGGDSELTREPNPFEPKKRSSGGLFSIGDFSAMDQAVLRVGFNADDGRVFTLQRSGRLRVFHLPELESLMTMARAQLGRPFTPQERETYFLGPE